MQLAQVIGTATTTVKHASLEGVKLLVVQLRTADGQSPDGHPILAADTLGAGRDEIVMVTSDGAGARQMLQTDKTPVRWTVIGLRD